MNSLPLFYLRRTRSRHRLCLTMLAFINRILFVLGVYLIAGLLMHTVYANTYSGMDENTDTNPYDSGHGSVWLRTADQPYIEALQMQTDVDITVSGPLARARVTQQFSNNSGYWMEGLYVFPLPENAAVDHFRLLIGDRIIEGRVKEKSTARKLYRQAKVAGKKTGLVEQQRPNVFSTSLANIAPGETIRVQIEYQQVLTYQDGLYTLRFPMTIGERYDPHARVQGSARYQHTVLRRDGLQQSETNPPPVETLVDEDRRSNPTRIHVLLDAGVSLEALDSRYHKINITQTSEHRFSIATIGENIVSDRDFELAWKPQLVDAPQLAAFTEHIDGEDYTLLTVLPPGRDYLARQVRARDLVFVLDISGSMSGTSIEQAKAALINALDRLRVIDRFNIIWFNDKTGTAFPDFVPAEGRFIAIAKDYVNRLQADGGTQMEGALQQALSRQQPYGRFRQVIFLTDGHIGNEEELFRLIDRHLGDSRLFTVGIGSAPNSYFMRKAANRGRGSFTYIGDVNEVKEKTGKLFEKLENPALVNITLALDHQHYDVFPGVIPDLYAGDTASILIRGSPPPANLILSGDYAGSEWRTQAAVKTTSHSGIRIAWAREKLATLMSLYHEPGTPAQRESIKQAIVETAVSHHLVSRFTSLVAVDATPVNTSGTLQQQRLRNNRPQGWKKTGNGAPAAAFQLAMIPLPQTATPARQQLYTALLLAGLALLLAAVMYRRKCKQAGSGYA